MTNRKNVLLACLASACFASPTFANEEEQTLQLEEADVAVLQLVSVEQEANENANELHQETTVGRAGLQGNCIWDIIFPDPFD